MKRGTDDEALSWGDENDPTYVAPDVDDPDNELAAEADSETVSTDGVPAPGVDVDAAGSPRWASTTVRAANVAAANETAMAKARNSQAEAEAEADEDAAVENELRGAEAASRPLSSAALIVFGIFGGILFLYTIGWLIGFLRNPPTGDGLGGIVQGVLAVLTIFAPALWFTSTLLLGAKRPVRTRLLWLIIGVIVLVPWPFVTGY